MKRAVHIGLVLGVLAALIGLPCPLGARKSPLRSSAQSRTPPERRLTGHRWSRKMSIAESSTRPRAMTPALYPDANPRRKL